MQGGQWNQGPCSVLHSSIVAMATHQRLDLDHITGWDWRLCIHDGGHVGHTFHPYSSVGQRNHLPPVTRRCHRHLMRGSSAEPRDYNCYRSENEIPIGCCCGKPVG